MSENQLLEQTSELLFNHVYAEVCSVPDLSDIHDYCHYFFLRQSLSWDILKS